MGDAVVNPAEPEVPAQSFPERLMGVFISPGETFEDVARKPGFWAPLITFVIGSVAVVETMLWKIGMERIVRMQLAQSSRASSMSPEDLDQAVPPGASYGAIIAHVVGVVGRADWSVGHCRHRDSHRECDLWRAVKLQDRFLPGLLRGPCIALRCNSCRLR